MASKRFEIDMALNASDVAKGADDAAMALSNLEDAVGDVADESKRSGNTVDSFAKKVVDAARQAGKSDDDIRQALRSYGVNAKDAERAIGRIGDEFKDTGRDGKRSLDDLEDGLRDVQRQSERTERSIDDIGSVGHKGFGKMGEAAQEVTQEVGQNLGEAVSSIRGNLGDLAQVGQDTLGGLAATLAGAGPAGIVGAAALAAAAIGLGGLAGEQQKLNAQVQHMKQYYADAWKSAVEGGRDYLDLSTVIAEANDIQFNPDRASEYKQIQDDAKKLSLDTNTLVKAAAGDQDALNAVLSRTSALYDEQSGKVTADSMAAIDKRGRANQAEAAKELSNISQINDRWKQYGEVNSENQRKAQDAARLTSDYLLDAVSKADSATRAVDDFGNTLITLPTGEQVVIEAKTGQATSDISKFKTDTDGVIDHVNGREVVLKARVDTSYATAQYNKWIKDHDGRSIKIGTRVITPDGGWNG